MTSSLLAQRIITTEGLLLNECKMRWLFFLFLLYITHQLKGQKSIHSLWTTALKEYVDEEGKVNYLHWKKDTKLLDDYISSLEENPPANYWTKMILWLIS